MIDWKQLASLRGTRTRIKDVFETKVYLETIWVLLSKAVAVR